MNTNTRPQVVRITTTEFELSDGRIFQHVMPLDPVPTPEEFQAFYDQWSDRLKNYVENDGSRQHKDRG